MATTKGVDWNAVRNKYIRSDDSYRDLANRYNIPLSKMAERAKKEHWVQKREQFKRKKEQKVEEKMAEAAANEEIENLQKINGTATFLLEQIEKAAREEINLITVRNRVQTKISKTLEDGSRQEVTTTDEHVKVEECTVDMNRLRQITGALREVAEIITMTSQKRLDESDEFNKLLVLIGGGNDATD